MYNESHFLFAIGLTMIIIPLVGCVLGWLADIVMSHIGARSQTPRNRRKIGGRKYGLVIHPDADFRRQHFPARPDHSWSGRGHYRRIFRPRRRLDGYARPEHSRLSHGLRHWYGRGADGRQIRLISHHASCRVMANSAMLTHLLGASTMLIGTVVGVEIGAHDGYLARKNRLCG